MKNMIRKSFRSIWRNKKSYGASILVLSIGMMIFICMLSVMTQMREGIQKYYADTRFAHIFATVKGMPQSKAEKLAEIDGIHTVQGLLSQDVKVVMAEVDYIVKLKLVGVNNQEETLLNQYAYEGFPLQLKKDLWLGEEFYNSYQLEFGDTITLLVNGKEEYFTVNGTVTSPEYVYIVDGNAAMSNPDAYTVGFVQKQALEKLLNMENIVTDISFYLDDDVLYEDMENVLYDELKPYGIQSFVKQEKQTSNDRLMGEVNELMVIGTILPVLFLFASMIMMYILLKRLVEQERGEIGTLKAFGFRPYEILTGYMANAFICGLLAYGIAVLAGIPFGRAIYGMYRDMFALPDPIYQLSGKIACIGFFLSIGVSLLAAWLGAGDIIKIHPAEAMRQASPKVQYGKVAFKGRFVRKFLNQKGKMVLRGLSRNKVRTVLTVLCIAFSFAMINVIFAMGDAVDGLIKGQTAISEVYDIKIALEEMKPLQMVLQEAKKIDGVLDAEGLLAAPVTLIYENKQETVGLYGLQENSSLYRIRDTGGAFYPPPKDGVLLNTAMAEKLGVQTGDIIEISGMYLRNPVAVTVTGVFQEPMGAGCYMELKALSRLFETDAIANTLLLQIEEEKAAWVQSHFMDSGIVSAIVNQQQVEASNKTMMESMNIMITMFVAMSFFMALGAIYSIARITLTEKQRELATMRILGFTNREVSAIHTYEQWLLFACAILFGFIPAFFLKDYIAGLFNNDYYSLQINLTLHSNIYAFLGCAFAMALTNRLAEKEIAGYALTDVLKERA